MIVGKKTQLRAIEKEDMVIFQKWMNDPLLTIWLGPRFPISLDEQNRWYEKLITDTSKRKYLIENLEGKPIGVVSLMALDLKNRCSEFGIYLGEQEAIGKGFGKDASMTLINFAFSEVGLNRLYLYVLEENNRAIKSFEECGFRKEAVLRENVFFNRIFHNQLIMGMLKNEFNYDYFNEIEKG